jgi:hypothetical protein
MPNRIAHTVLAMGALPADVEAAVVQMTRRRLARLDVDELGTLSTKTRVLLVGEGYEEAMLHSILLSVRERHPSLTIVAVTAENVPARASFADWSYRVHDDNVALLGCISGLIAPHRNFDLASLLRALTVAASPMIVLAAWFVIARAGMVPPYFLPPPKAVFLAFAGNPNSFLMHTAVTASEAFVGYVLGNTLGVATAILLFRYQWVRGLSLPWITGLQAIPIVALAPLLSIWQKQ